MNRKMKVTLVGLLAAVSMQAFAATMYTNEVNGIKWVYTLSGGKATLGGGNSSTPAIAGNPSGKVEIPSALGETPVVAIASYAFSGKTGIKDLTVPNSVTNIGNYAFQNCSSVTNLVIAKGTQYIGYGAFGGCASLESLTVPFVGKRRGNDGLTEALFGYMFGNNSSQGSRQIRQYYGSSSSYNYYIPTNLVNVVVTDETKIGYGAFYGCEDLCSVTIGDGVTAIGTYAFYNCSRLEDVTLPDSVKSIDSTAFNGCAALNYDTTTVPGLKLIDGWVAGYTSQLNGAVDLTNVRGLVGEAVFKNCPGITELIVPGTMETIPDNAFYGCTNLVWVTLAEGVRSIGKSAFYGCAKLQTINIPSSLTNSGESAFYNCTKLSNVSAADLTSWFGIKFGNGDANPVRYAQVLRVNGEPVVDLVVPGNVTRIKNHAFYYDYGLRSITMHDGVIDVEKSAFCNCGGVTNVAFSSGLTNIALYAFYECTNISEVVLNEGLRSIGDYAFQGGGGTAYGFLAKYTHLFGFCRVYPLHESKSYLCRWCDSDS